jgi:hypothetical protein
MKHRSSLNANRLAGELSGLPALDRRTLIEKWQTLYGTEPASRIPNNFLMHAIAHRMQEQVLGGLKPATRRFLENTVKDNTPRQLMISIKPGTRLLREWHGVTYEVIIMEDAVMCNGKRYRSLSEAARAITGARWSGPLFFGLKKQDVH